MRLRISKDYIEELIEKYRDGSTSMVGGFGYQQSGLFTFLSKTYIVLLDERQLVLVKLGFTGEVSSVTTLSKDEIKSIKLRKGVIAGTVTITPARGKKCKLRLQKAVIGLREQQEETWDMLERLSAAI